MENLVALQMELDSSYTDSPYIERVNRIRKLFNVLKSKEISESRGFSHTNFDLFDQFDDGSKFSDYEPPHLNFNK